MLAIKHQQGPRNSMFGRTWIHKEGEKPVALNAGCLVPEGWAVGRNQKKPKREYGTFGKVWINDGRTNKLIHGSHLIPDGWERGRIMNMIVRSSKLGEQDGGAEPPISTTTGMT